MNSSESLDVELEVLKLVTTALARVNEKQREWVVKTALDRLQTPLPAGSRPVDIEAGHEKTPRIVVPAASTSIGSRSPKQFLKEKNPVTEPQRVACLAYYLAHARNQQHFKTRVLTKLNSEAAWPNLSNPSMIIGNATRQNRFLAAGEKGHKQITSLGEEVVDALPDQAAVKAVIAAHRKPRRGR